MTLRLILVALLAAHGVLSCSAMPADEACKAICTRLRECSTADNACEATCEANAARSKDCSSATSHLGDCYDTYTCSGLGACGDESSAYVRACG